MAAQQNQKRKLYIDFLVPGSFEKKRPSFKNAFPPSPKFNVDALGKRKAHLKRLEGSTLNCGEGGDVFVEDGLFFRTTRTPFYDDFTLRCDALMVII